VTHLGSSFHDSIVAVRDKALSEVQTVVKKAERQVDTLVKESVEAGTMRAEALDLGELIRDYALYAPT